MPVERTGISHSQLADLLGLEPGQFLAVERQTAHTSLPPWTIVTEGAVMQTSGTFPELTKKPKKKGKR